MVRAAPVTRGTATLSLLGPVWSEWAVAFLFQAEAGIRFHCVTGVQRCALPIYVTEPPTAIVRPVWVNGAPGVPSQSTLVSSGSVTETPVRVRSEERRVGKECRSRWSPDH